MARQTVSKDVVTTINSWIAEIDHKLSLQLSEVMHCDEFQRWKVPGEACTT